MGFISEWLEWREKAAPGSTALGAPDVGSDRPKGMHGGRLSVWQQLPSRAENGFGSDRDDEGRDRQCAWV